MRGQGFKRDIRNKLRRFFLRRTMTGHPMTDEEMSTLNIDTPEKLQFALEGLQDTYKEYANKYDNEIKELHNQKKLLLQNPNIAYYRKDAAIKDINNRIKEVNALNNDLQVWYQEAKQSVRIEKKNPVTESRFGSPMEASVIPSRAPRLLQRLYARTEPVGNYRGAEELPVAQAFPEVYPIQAQEPEDPELRRAMEESERTRSEERRARGEGVKRMKGRGPHGDMRRAELRSKIQPDPILAHTLGQFTEAEAQEYLAAERQAHYRNEENKKREIDTWKIEKARNPDSRSQKEMNNFIRELYEDIDNERIRYETIKKTVREIVRNPDFVNESDKEVIQVRNNRLDFGRNDVRTLYNPTEIQQSERLLRGSPINPNMPRAQKMSLTTEDKRRRDALNKASIIPSFRRMPMDVKNEIRDFIEEKPTYQNPAVVAQREGQGIQSPWIKHVKAYQKKHGCSYKDAMKGASKTYR